MKEVTQLSSLKCSSESFVAGIARSCRIATERDVNVRKKALYFPQLFEESRYRRFS
jgi:hypothetical protein